MPDNLEQLAAMISRRDGISINEARNIIDDTREEIQELIAHNCHYVDIEETLAYNLGLEPDYIELFLFE